MSLWICPICGKQNSIKHYDPTDFDEDIPIIRKRGLGRGMGFEEVDRYSLLDGSNPELLDLISDRVAVIYDMLYEDVETDDEAEDVEDDDEEQAQPMTPLDREIQIAEEEENEDEGEGYEDGKEAIREVLAKQAELEKLIEEAKEVYPVLEDNDEEKEDEDINDLEENIIE